MEYAVAVFLSRNQTLAFANELNKVGVPNAIISTPSVIGRACGISVKFFLPYKNDVTNIISRHNFFTLKGIYKIVQNGININYVPI